MVLPNNKLVPTIIFFHFLGNGLVLPVLSKQVLKYGGNHIILGALHSIVFICNFISKDVLVFFESGKKSILNLSLYTCFACFVGMILATSCWRIMMLRVIYAFTTQIVFYSKEYIGKSERQEAKIKISNLIDIMRVAGLASGAVIGGFIYEKTKNFVFNLYFGSAAAFIALIFLHLLPEDGRSLQRIESQLFLYQKSCLEQLDNLRKTNYSDKWNTVFLKFITVYVYMIFFSRFIFLLIYNYKVNSIIVGCVRSYYYVLTFAASCIVPFIKDISEDLELLFENSLMISGFALIAICYAPTLLCYLICFIPLVFTHSLVTSLFADDILKLKSERNLFQASETLCIIANIIAPITSGIMRHLVGGKILKLFTVIPICLYGFLLNKVYWERQRRRSQWIEFPHQLPKFSSKGLLVLDEEESEENLLRNEEPDEIFFETESQENLNHAFKRQYKKSVVLVDNNKTPDDFDEEDEDNIDNK